jgi:hypothetical protein
MRSPKRPPLPTSTPEQPQLAGARLVSQELQHLLGIAAGEPFGFSHGQVPLLVQQLRIGHPDREGCLGLLCAPAKSQQQTAAD